METRPTRETSNVHEDITIVGPDALPEEWLARIKPELAPGERLIWAGQSKPSRARSGRSVAMIWGSGFAVIAIFGFAGLSGALGPTIAESEQTLANVAVCSSVIAFLIVIGLIAHGLGGVFNQPSMTASLYALTDLRAIIWSPSAAGVAVVSHRRGTIKSVHRVEFPDGSGSVHFTTPGLNFFGLTAGFLNVADARRVEALIRLHLIAEPSIS